MTSFLEHALLRRLLQHDLRNTEVRSKVERKAAKFHISNIIAIQAEDYGRIYKVRERHEFWKVEHLYQALLEAKRVFKDIELSEKENKRVPVLPNECPAHYLGEAVITWGSIQRASGNRFCFQRDVLGA
ncbi:hypothetical protein IWW34DRAFT_886978 [Fusarium oxysporum f. sp. albedinis]|nr:hypothetical protein IWW34DRAFT_886978 [Fusarium oxysporum f. sp. albedinis]